MRIVILTGMALLAICGSAHALDCMRPGAPAEYVVCGDKSLEKLLDRRRQAYEAARARSGESAKKALAEDERRWRKNYQEACGLAAAGGTPVIDKAVVRCVAHAFAARIRWLRNYKPSDAPAAKRAAVQPPQPNVAPKPRAIGDRAGTPIGPASVRVELTFACRTPAELTRVLRALAAKDLDYPLNQPDCLPLVKGRAVQVIAIDGKVAKLRLCSPDVGCTEVYADAGSILPPAGGPAASGAPVPDPLRAGGDPPPEQ
jgi:uncharacterized protein